MFHTINNVRLPRFFIKASAILTAALLSASCAAQESDDYDYTARPDLNVITAESETTAEEVTILTTAETEPEPEEISVTFTALGDNLIHSSIYKQAERRAGQNPDSGKKYDFSYAYEGVADLLNSADITVINQETLICGESYPPSTYPRFNSPEELGDYMNTLGVDVYTIANNHVLDMGEKGLADCLSYYDSRNMTRAGAYYNEEDRKNIRIVERNGVKISFLSYTESLNGLSLPQNSEMQIGMTDIEQIKREITEAKKISDICVVSLHWGLENSSDTEDYQREAAREIAAAGADAIIGNHPHVLREIEVIENPDGRETLCAYSLGNFISAQAVGKNLIGGVLDFEITLPPDGSSPAKITDVELIPIITHYDANYSNVRLYKLSDYTPELASSHGVRANSQFSYEYILEYLEKQGLTEYIK